MKIKVKIILSCLIVLLFTFLTGTSYIFKDLDGINVFSFTLGNYLNVFANTDSEYRYGYLSMNANNTFNKGIKLTRSEIAEMIFKIENLNYEDDYVFSDTKDNAYVGIISAIVKKGYMEGNNNDMFLPDNYLTRGDFAVIVMNIIKNNKSVHLQKNIRTYENNFDDIENDINKEAIIKCYEYGLTNSNKNSKFRPYDFITKEEVIVILNKVYGYDKADYNILLNEYNKNPYVDIDDTYWAFEDIVRATVGLE